MRKYLCPLLVVLLLSQPIWTLGQNASIHPDRPDYHPLSNAVFTGNGFAAFEQVTLKVKNITQPCNTTASDSSYSPWSVQADANGHFVTNWTVCNCPGDSLRVKATGAQSGRTAFALFSDSQGTPASTIISTNKVNFCVGDLFILKFTTSLPGPGFDWVGQISNPGGGWGAGVLVQFYPSNTVGESLTGPANETINGIAYQNVYTITSQIPLPQNMNGSSKNFDIRVNDDVSGNVGNDYGHDINNSVVTIYEPATAEAGANISTCANAGPKLLSSSGTAAANYEALEWRSSGTGTFANTGNLTTATYTPSQADIDAGVVTITLAADGFGGCGEVTDSKTLTIDKVPAFSGQPSSVTKCATDAVSFSVTASTIPATTVSWQYRNSSAGSFANVPTAAGDIYSGESTSTLNISNVAGLNGYEFRAVASNTCGSSNSDAAILTVNAVPGIVCPSTVTINCQDAQDPDINTNLGKATGTGGCSSLTVSFTDVSGKGSNPSLATFYNYTITRTWKATDGNGNSATCQQTITVRDITRPDIDCPTQVNVFINSLNCVAQNVALGLPTGSDNCTAFGALSFTNNHPSTSYPLGQTTVVWTVTDGAGNTNTCQQIVNVTDNTKPNIQCPARVDIFTNTGCTATGVGIGMATATDNCSAVAALQISNDHSSTTFPLGVTTVTWTVTDEAGNTNSCEQVVNVTDITKPSINTNGDKSVNTDASLCTATVTVSASTSDNCTVGAATGVRSDGMALSAGYPVGITTITWMVTDANGNTQSTTQTVTVTDNVKPTITPNGNKSVNTDAGICTASVSVSASTSDNCTVGAATAVRSDGLALNAAYPVGITTITWTVTDANGNTQSATQTVTVTDNVKPTITPNGNKSVYTDAGLCTAIVSVSASTSDNCTVGAATGVRNDGMGLSAGYPVGTTTIIWTVTDANGNTQSTTQTVTVTDNVKPTITPNGNKSVNTDTGICTAPVSVSASTSDNCTVGAATGVRSDGLALSAGYAVGITTITWTVTDANGNTQSTTQTVTVTDNVKPTITPNGNKSVNTDAGLCTASVPVSASTSDNCTVGAATGVRSDGMGLSAGYPVGITTITWTGTDASGNTQTATQTVTVTDITPPVIGSCVGGSMSTTRYVNPVTGNYAINGSEFDRSATDNCSIASMGYVMTGPTSATGSGSLSGSSLSLGNYVIIWKAVDVYGNSTTCTINIAVEKTGTLLTITRPIPVSAPARNSGQYSDQVTIEAQLTDGSGNPLNNKPVKLSVGLQYIGSFTTNSNGIVSTIVRLADNPNLTDNEKIVASFAGDMGYLSSNDTDDFDVKQEDALVDYTGQMQVSVVCATCSTTNVLLSASVKDIQDSYPGDIRKARVKFLIKNGTTVVNNSGWITPTLPNPADSTAGLVVYQWTNAPVPSNTNTPDIYDVVVKVDKDGTDGYYVGRYISTLNIVRSDAVEFITGGGYIRPTNSLGTYKADNNSKMNFGFNIKWNKSVKNLLGKINVIYRANGQVYQLKSSATNTLTINSTNACSKSAIFIAKGNLNNVSNPDILPVPILTGLTIQLNITDNGEPGNNDKFGVTAYNGSTLVFSSTWNGSATQELVMEGGNIVVHSGADCPNAISNTRMNTTPVNIIPSSETEDPATPKADESKAKIYPNPSATSFVISVQKSSKKSIQIKISDVKGYVQEQFQLLPGQTKSFGDHYPPGMYFIEIRQGDQREVKKLVKL